MEGKQQTSQLGAIPETMLITLWAKATETERAKGILKDEKAREIIQKIDYNFDKFKSSILSQIGVCVRAKLIDDETRNFIAQNPDAVIIQLGAGLDMRYQRLGCPPVTHWYDLDLPEVISLREKLIGSNENSSYLSLSLFDYQWVEKVQEHKKPVLIIVEGVLMYFPEDKVKSFFDTICNRFDKATVLFDMLFYKGVGQVKRHDAVRSTSSKPQFKWALLNSTEMERWNSKIHLAKEYYMSDYYPANRLPIWKFLYKITWVYRNLNQRVVKLEIF